MTNTIETFTGKIVDPFNLKVSDICIEDMAHSLSMKTRFTGHGKFFCSIAEHSVNVSILLDYYQVDLYGQLAGVLHEGDEVHFPDLATPVKQNSVFDLFREYANRASDTVYSAFMPLRLVADYKPLIKTADYIMLAAEAEMNFESYATGDHWAWVRHFSSQHPGAMDLARKLKKTSGPRYAEKLYLARYHSLQNKIAKQKLRLDRAIAKWHKKIEPLVQASRDSEKITAGDYDIQVRRNGILRDSQAHSDETPQEIV